MHFEQQFLVAYIQNIYLLLQFVVHVAKHSSKLHILHILLFHTITNYERSKSMLQ